MEMRQVTPDFSVSDQLMLSDLPILKATGIRAIICNRPDGEEPNQPGFAEIKQAASELGLKAIAVPVASTMVSEQDVADFGHALDTLPKPALAYCRTGTRSATLWSALQTPSAQSADA